MDSAEIQKFTKQCSSNFDEQFVEKEIQSLLALHSENAFKFFFERPVGYLEKMTNIVCLDGLRLEGLSQGEVGIIDILTKDWETRYSYNAQKFPVETVLENSIYKIRRLCKTNMCEDRRVHQVFSLKSSDTETCSSLLCAVKKIFGPRKGPLILLSYLKHKLILSPFVEIDGDPDGFDIETLQAILTAAELIPTHLSEQILSKGYFFRFLRGRKLAIYKDRAVVATAAGAVFDLVDTFDFNEKVYLFLHELGHRASYVKGIFLDETPEWTSIASDGASISDYSLENSAENFAESFVLYRLNPLKFKSLSMPRYTYMKNRVFGGYHYETQLCTGSQN